MAKVYGYSDDIVCIEHLEGGCTEIDCYDKIVAIQFDDMTTIRCGYGKKSGGIWWIKVTQEGSAQHELTVCDDEDADVYSDVFTIDAEAVLYECLPGERSEGE